MCGISGIWDPDRRLGLEAADLKNVAGKMADRLAHRGPDDRGEWSDPEAGLALGHRRLSILDLSPTGSQPMTSASGRFCIAFNGEIYNCRDLRQRLEGGGVRFRGTSDTEVLIEAVEAWGLDQTLSRITGMFAFALWDRLDKQLHLVRDRLGEKPLYLLDGPGWMAFASELKSFQAIPEWVPEIDRSSVAEFVSYGYIGAPRSIYAGVTKMLPGTVLTVSADDLPLGDCSDRMQPYWALPARSESAADSLDDETVLDQFENLLTSVVEDQSLADVPVGAFLSGGVDSSTVVALLQSVSPHPVRTFTVRFPVASHDESAWAGRVARSLGTDHTVLEVDAGDLVAAVPEMGRVYDEPFADPSQVPTYLISREARRHVKVCLTGDGGDEVFGGYNRYLQFRRTEQFIGSVPTALRSTIGRCLKMLPVSWLDAVARRDSARGGEVGPLQSAGAKVHKLAAMLTLPDAAARYDSLLRTSVPEGLVLGVETASAVPALGDDAGEAIEDLLMRRDLVSYLPDDNLVKVDRASMAHGLECRAPILDHRVIEAALGLPIGHRIREGKGKWVLRSLFARHLPAELLERPKAGFSVPVSEWFRRDLRGWIEEMLAPDRLGPQGFFDVECVGQALGEHVRGVRDHGRFLWALGMFQTWLESRTD